jgi:hypothetical protein
VHRGRPVEPDAQRGVIDVTPQKPKDWQ